MDQKVNASYNIEDSVYEFIYSNPTQHLSIFLVESGSRKQVENIPPRMVAWVEPFKRKGTNDKSYYITFWITNSESKVYTIQSPLSWRELSQDEIHTLFPQME